MHSNSASSIPPSVWHLFEQAARDNGQHEAIVDPSNRPQLCGTPPARLSYAALRDLSLRYASVLHAAGIGTGDVVLVQLPNIHELTALYLAVARLGAIIAPLPMQYRRHEIQLIESSAQPAALISLSRFKDDSPLQAFADVAHNGRPCFALDGNAPAHWLNLTALAEWADPLADNVPPPNEETLFTLCWTSGTTGTPKGVPRRHRHWLAMIPVFEDATALPDHAPMLAPFPMVNMAAISVFLIYWLSVKGQLVLHHPMDLPVFLQQISEENIQYTVAPPALLSLLLAQPELLQNADLSSLRVIGSGSAPLAPSMIQGFKQRFEIDVVNMFGSNEGCCLVSDATDIPDPEQRASFFPRFGYPEFGWSNRMAGMLATQLVDIDSGETIEEAGRPGELRIKGPTVFEGYWRSPETHREVFDDDGFFRTGDLFEIAGDRGQFYRFVGRCKDIIVRGGMKIAPEELDQLLAGHPQVREAAAVGVADEHLGQRVCAVVVPRDDQKPSLESLCAHLSEQGLAKFKLPEKLFYREALPRNPLGKVMRHQLEEAVRE